MMIKENVKEFLKDACYIEEKEITEEMIENAYKLLNELSDREERIIRLRYGLDDGKTRTLMEVAGQFGVDREIIRQAESTAIKKLRHPTRRKLLGR